MINSYMVGGEPLTEEEKNILYLIEMIKEKIKRPVREEVFHMMMSIAGIISIEKTGKELYKFEPKTWETIDERFKTGSGSIPYSEKLHNVVESLVKKHYLVRDSNEPLILYKDKQLRLF